MGVLRLLDPNSKWVPNADALKARNVFLRADNLVLNDLGILTPRNGSVATALSGGSLLDVRSIHFSSIDEQFVSAGSSLNNRVWINGTQSPTIFDFISDEKGVTFGNWLSHVFMAAGTIKRKWDTFTETRWGIGAPTLKPTLKADPSVARLLASCNQSESPAFVANFGTITGTFPQGADGTTNGAIEVTPSADGFAVITKTFTNDEDYSKLLSDEVDEDEYDLFDMQVWVAKPQEHIAFTVMIGVSPGGADPFISDFYQYDFKLSLDEFKAAPVITEQVVVQSIERKANKKARQKPEKGTSKTQGKGAKRKAKKRAQEDSDARAAGGPTTTTVVTRTRQDPSSSDNDWTRITVARGVFKRVGSTNGRDWKTVRAIRLIYRCTPGGTGKVRFDNVRVVSCGKALNGEYKVYYRFAKDYTTQGFQEVSPPSEEASIRLNAQAIVASVPAAALAAADAHADQVWWYVRGGYLDQFYRALVTPTITPLISSLQFADEFSVPPVGIGPIQSYRLATIDLSPGGTTGGDLTVVIATNEVDILMENEPGEHDQLPPDHIRGMATFASRLLVIAQQFGSRGAIWASGINRPASFREFHVFKLSDQFESLMWIIATSTVVYVGTSTDIYVISGSGAELPDGSIDLAIRGLNIGSPPASEYVAKEGNFIVYRASDGWRVFNGVDSSPLSMDDIDLLYQGQTRHGLVPATAGFGRGAVLSNGWLWGHFISSIIHVYDFGLQRWYMFDYGVDIGCRCMARDSAGNIFIGSVAGTIWKLNDPSAFKDGTVNIACVLWSASEDAGDPLSKKDSLDHHIRWIGPTLSVGWHLDGSGTAALSESPANVGETLDIWKTLILTPLTWRNIQMRLTSNGATAAGVFLKLYEAIVNFRGRPMHRVAIDTGFMRVGRTDMAWAREIRVCCQAGSLATLVTVEIYFDHGTTPAATKTFVPIVNAVSIYTVYLPRTCFGLQPRVRITSTAASGIGERGVEVYWVEVRYAPSGNTTQKPSLWKNPDQIANPQAIGGAT